MGQVHVLNGDALAEMLKDTTITGEVVVCRECLIDGPSKPTIDDAFWKMRAAFINKSFGNSEDEYMSLRSEFNKMSILNEQDQVNLWFENDLFCQANMWFVMAFLNQFGYGENMYRVFPAASSPKNKWATFDHSSPKVLEKVMKTRSKVSRKDQDLGVALWFAYSSGNLNQLKELSKVETDTFQFLDEVVQAHIERFDKPGRPQRTLMSLQKQGLKSLKEIFPRFSQQEAIYGFGDTQVEQMLTRLN